MRADPVSTGGGGTVLEHRYGATLLASLLAGDPVPALGDDVTPLRIHFQCTSHSPVDDLTVVGRTPSGSSRVLSIGVRRTPVFAASSAPTVALIRTYVQAAREKWTEIEAGRLRLGLASLEPNAGVREVARLAEIARTCSGNADFRVRVAHRSLLLARRLKHFDSLVAAASGSPELSWRVLFALRMIDATDETNRNRAVSGLRPVTRERTAGVAGALYDRLAWLAGDYAPAGAWVDETVLRKDLDGWPLRRSDSHPRAWALLDRLVVCLRDRTPPGLRTPHGEFEIDRQAARSALCDAFHLASTDGSAVLVTGEPEVGKSALAMRAAENLPFGNVVLSLRDLPKTMLEFEASLGADVTEVLGKIVISGSGLLVVDGAEAVLEGHRTMLIDLVTCALKVGLGVAAVTRTDGESAVADCLGIAVRALGRACEQARQVVQGLDDAEVAQLTTTLAGLGHLATDRRSAWVLRRPGLIDLVMRSKPAAMPAQAMSEADVFALIWHGLVRDAEKSSPDGREQTLLALARRLLTQERSTLDPDALASLRSDGLVLPRGPLSAWGPGEEFTTDLVRDLAVARLLLADGWTVLATADAPRWALRAARLACQAALPRRDHVAFFEQLAAVHGRRWAELPLEAMLTSTDATEQLERVWPLLSGSHRADLLRLARDRYTRDGVGDPVVLTPLVDLFYCQEGDRSDEVRDTVLAWLRGVLEDDHVPLRPVVRALADDLELIALLGADLDARAAAVLYAAPPAELAVALENPFAPRSMAAHCPDLLFDLCEAFYAAVDTRRYVRRVPCGCEPFHTLLEVDSTRALRLINALLAKAAAWSHHNGPTEYVRLEFPDGSWRSCVGSSMEWQWYREDGPWEHHRYHCALTAVEQMVDHAVASGVPVADAVDPLLRDCVNTPMSGLAFGLLQRHASTSPSALDTWLCQPDIWQLEKSRQYFAGALQHRRASTDRDVLDLPLWWTVGRLVLAAEASSDLERVDAFAEIGAELTRRVEQDKDVSDWMEWVRMLLPTSYDLVSNQGELIHVDLQSLFPQPEKPDRDDSSVRIGVHYSEFGVEPGDVDRLCADLDRLRRPTTGKQVDRDIEQVAIAVIATHVRQTHTFSDDDLLWCASRLIDITSAALLADDVLGRLDPHNWDALTTLLLPSFDSVGFDRVRLEDCLTASVLATHIYSFDALSPIWAAGCSTHDRCRHEMAWDVLVSVIGDEPPSGYALVQCIEAAQSAGCAASPAGARLDDLLDAYRDKLRQPQPRYATSDQQEELAVAGALFSIAADGDLAVLLDHIDLLCRQPDQLGGFLANLCWQATYRSDLRQALPQVWPTIMRSVLASEHVVHGYHLTYLLPVPRAQSELEELANSTWLVPHREPLPPSRDVLAAARAEWLAPVLIADLIEQWANRVSGKGSAQNVFVAYAQTTSPHWQVHTAMPLLEQIIGNAPRVSEHETPLLPGWLTDLHESGLLTPAATKILHRVVDAHVAAGDTRLVPLQLALE